MARVSITLFINMRDKFVNAHLYKGHVYMCSDIFEHLDITPPLKKIK